jgi:hypothetical protein
LEEDFHHILEMDKMSKKKENLEEDAENLDRFTPSAEP